METAKVFTNGASQAVRLPKSCRFDCAEVGVQKVGNIVILFDKATALESFMQSAPLDEDVFEAIREARLQDSHMPLHEISID